MSAFVLSWQDFWTRAALLADRLKGDSKSSRIESKTKLWIPSLDAQQGLFLFAAALHLGLDPVFDEKSSLDLDATYLQSSPELWQTFAKEQGLPLDNSQFMLSADQGIPVGLLEAIEQRDYYFSSSGSTAKAKTLCKSAEGLLRESKVLQNLYGLQANSKIVALVRPFHIYGFLHSVLLPLTSAGSAVYWSTQLSLPTEENGFPVHTDLTITVPAHWSVLTHLWSDHRTPTVVSSGAFFGQERAAELLKHKESFERYFEILGSTETGGIGYRRVDQEGYAFTLFEGIRVEARTDGGDGSLIYSPFLIPESSISSPDRFEQLADQRVLHLGRADRVFKYAGLRYTLGEVEDMMSKACDGASVVCTFEENSNSPQGGLLRSWIETRTLSAVDLIPLRKKYQSFGNRPFPAALHFVPEFPRDAQGKVSFLELKRLI